MDELVRLHFLRPLPLYDEEKPYYIFADIPEEFPRGNLEYEDGPEQLISDVRGHEHEFSLQQQGFMYRSWIPPKLNWEDEQEIVGKYIPSVQTLLAEILDLGEALKRNEVFDWRVRQLSSTHHSVLCVQDLLKFQESR